MLRPFKILHPASDVESKETHGHSWADESVQENIELCRYQPIEAVFCKYLPKNGKILEAGCGLGRWVFYLRERGYDVVGIDLATVPLEIAKKFDPNAPLFLDDVLHSKYADQSMAAVISLGVVEHFEEGPQKAFAEVSRLLPRGGLFLVSVPLLNTSRALVSLKLKQLYWRIKMRKGVRYVFEEYRYPREFFENLLDNAGYDIIDTVYDELTPPRNIGVYVDYPMFRHSTLKWQLNTLGKLCKLFLGLLGPHSTAGGMLWVCRKR